MAAGSISKLPPDNIRYISHSDPASSIPQMWRIRYAITEFIPFVGKKQLADSQLMALQWIQHPERRTVGLRP